MPRSVDIAIKVLWASLVINALLSLLGKVIGVDSLGSFIGALIVTGLYCIIPYKLANRSNAARYVYLILTIISVLIMIAAGNEIPMSNIDKLNVYITLPMNIYTLYLLFFNDEAKYWFKSN
ncbi:hypothetical protein [Alkanindiges illinoisensis]|uniref:hypothetical protein n=1 Tax=Alkanindiges illinoisensis TaxID=197183 RepID=UPI00047C32B0|nr:hypothetical protein [Alkanindiges illinoisensis]